MFKAIRLAAALFFLFLMAAGSVYGQAPVPAATDSFTNWPLTIQAPSGNIQIFQPQPDKLVGDKLSARAAVSLTLPGATGPVFGAIWLTARVATDRDARTVTIVDLAVRRVRFPEATDAQQAQFTAIVQQQIPQMHVTFSLDQLMASLDVAEKEKVAAQELSSTPPKIIFVPAPATLVLIDGPPQLQPTPDQPGLMRVVNSPFIILFDSSSKQYFLKAGMFWYTSGDVLQPWTNVASIPANVLAEGNALTAPPPAGAPGNAAPEQPAAAQPNPGQIIVSEEPAELISTNGEPAYTPLPGNNLLYVSNTQSDVFLEVASQQTYVLLSGRWFTSHGLQGPWTYVPSDHLPAAFAQIPPDSPKANVLAAVGGTVEAHDARLDAQVPQTAAVDRNAGASLNVTYDGAPQFEAIPQIPVSYAVNTPDAVLFTNNRYYCCHQGVWYESAAAVGPWSVCLSVPDAIYTIPPTCPDYFARYCYVYDVTPDLVYCGYLPGYTGCYIYGPTVVFGTGYYYRGWYGHDYFPRPWTWGFGVSYDLSIGTWGFGASYRFNRSWFIASGVHRGWWGPRGYIDYHALPHAFGGIGHFNADRNYINRLNVYNRSDNVRRNIVRNSFTRNENRVENIRQTSGRAENNVYAGHNGEVYRRTNEGWEQNTAKGWTPTRGVPEEHVEGRQAERPAEQAPARIERPAEQAPARIERPSEPARVERPVEREPAREAPTFRQESPSRSYGGGGMEAERAARERGAERTGGGFERSGGGGERSGGGAERGGGGGRH